MRLPVPRPGYACNSSVGAKPCEVASCNACVLQRVRGRLATIAANWEYPKLRNPECLVDSQTSRGMPVLRFTAIPYADGARASPEMMGLPSTVGGFAELKLLTETTYTNINKNLANKSATM